MIRFLSAGTIGSEDVVRAITLEEFYASVVGEVRKSPSYSGWMKELTSMSDHILVRFFYSTNVEIGLSPTWWVLAGDRLVEYYEGDMTLRFYSGVPAQRAILSIMQIQQYWDNYQGEGQNPPFKLEKQINF